MRDDSKYIERIIKYCDQIQHDRERFGNDKESYYEDSSYQRSTDMSLQQIGETVNKLSADVLAEYDGLEWDAVIGFRNIVVHRYEWIDRERIWMIMCDDVPKLREYCLTISKDISKRKMQ